LDKAKKYLARAQLAATGDTKYQVALLLEEADSLSLSSKSQEVITDESVEFAVVEKIFGYLQIMSACLMAFAHGANDVANAIGPLAASIGILTTGTLTGHGAVPTWTLALGGFGIVVGLATWGWRVIETIGKKITELTPTRGFAAEFGAAATIVLATRLGMPISTTHTLVGSVIGVGMARGIEALDLSTTRVIIISWIVTVPVGALMAVGFFYIIHALF
jgi:phosphate/sulfate permease